MPVVQVNRQEANQLMLGTQDLASALTQHCFPADGEAAPHALLMLPSSWRGAGVGRNIMAGC